MTAIATSRRGLRKSAAAATLAAAIAAAPGAGPIPDAITAPPATADAIRANTERTYERIQGLPKGDLLLRYQQKALSEVSRSVLSVIEKSRRIGLTWGLAADSVLTAAARKDAGGDDVLYISYSQEMTREYIEACAMWARAFMNITAETREFLFDDQIEGSSETREIKAFRIRFSSGFEIVALSSAPRSLRGKQGKVIIDEAAFVDNLDELIKAALALQIWGSKIILVSTHNGAENPFNVLLEEIRSGQRRGNTIRITFADAMADGLYERVCLCTGRTPSAEDRIAWEAEIRGNYGEAADEELDCIPSAGKGSFISPELIATCEDANAGRPEFYAGGRSSVGWDVARMKHLSVIAPFEHVGPVLWLREKIEMVDVTFADQDDVLDRVMRDYRGGALRIDQTGLGMKVVEDAQARYGEFAVQGVMFSAAVKLVLATLLKERFERGLIRIPPDPQIRADLRSIKKSGKGTGAPIFEAEVQQAATGRGDASKSKGQSHGDRFWAYALACLAADDGGVAYEGYASGRARRKDAGVFSGGGSGGGRMKMRADDDDGPRNAEGAW